MTDARIIRKAVAQPIDLTRPEPDRLPCARLIPSLVVDAHLEAQRILQDAHRRAADVMDRVEGERNRVLEQAHQQGLERANAEFAARWIAVRALEVRSQEQALDRTVALARTLAERLIGAALTLEPNTVVSIAREVLRQSWVGDEFVVVANTADAQVLEVHLGELADASGSIQIRTDPHLESGHLRLESAHGTVDAAFGPQLDRLAQALHDALRTERAH